MWLYLGFYAHICLPAKNKDCNRFSVMKLLMTLNGKQKILKYNKVFNLLHAPFLITMSSHEWEFPSKRLDCGHSLIKKRTNFWLHKHAFIFGFQVMLPAIIN